MPPLNPNYDVLVIGGGPAGSSAGTRLAQADLRTLIVDRETFPRFRIGESHLPHGNHLLREIGVWPKLAAAGFIDKYGASFATADGSMEKEIVFADGLIPGNERTFQVERARFDGVLFEHARSCGATACDGLGVTAIHNDASGHTATLVDREGQTLEVRVKWIIDACGREGHYNTQPVRHLDHTNWPKRVAIYTHFTGVVRAPGRAGGHTVIVRVPHGWFWIIPIDAHRTSVGLVTTTTALRDSWLAPKDHFAAIVAGSVKMAGLMSASSPCADYRVTSDYSFFRRTLAEGRFVFAGDAGGFFDPIFSSGVYMACLSAKLAANLVIRAHRRDQPLASRACAAYTREVKRHAKVFRKLIEAFYDDDSFTVFMCQRPPWGLRPAITSIVAGCSNLTWGMRWRYNLFLLIYRLQKRFPLVTHQPV